MKNTTRLQDSRLILISNGEPYAHEYDEDGNVHQQKLAGGLTTGLDPLMQENKGLWIAWGRGDADFEAVNEQGKVKVPDDRGYTLKRLKLSDSEINGFYYGFSNETLWPISHSFIDKANFNPEYWQTYKKVNNKYADTALEEIQGNDFIWIHDYHLTLAPKIIREEKPDSRIAFFWHIPWPSWEAFGRIPWRKEILSGILASDFIGFHTQDLVDNFLQCADRIGADIDPENNLVNYEGHTTRLAAVPLGIDYEKFSHLAENPDLDTQASKIKKNCHANYLIFGIDRLDYTKGILQRLQAIDKLFQKYPDYRRQVTLIQRIAPSRTEVREYQKMRETINQTIGDINGRYREEEWVPIKYFHKSIPQEEIIPYYRAADVALITPLIDGMNLVSKEYVATAGKGVLILSEFAGAAQQLKEALFVNPYNIEEVADKIHQALAMNPLEKKQRLAELQNRVKEKDINWWKEKFLEEWMNTYE